MKIKLKIDEDSKKVLTLSDMPAVKRTVKYYKENEDALSWSLDTLKNMFDASEIIKSAASISKNCRVYNYFDDDSRNIDIWINATFYSNYSRGVKGGAFYKVGAYLTDIEKSTGDNWEELKGHMYIRRFLEVE